MGDRRRHARGFTIVELVIGLTVFSLVAVSFLTLFLALVNSSVIAKQRAVASTLATNQMEYLKSLPYDTLAIAGGAIYSHTPLAAMSTQTLNGAKYTVKSSINYADDAYDGCGSYPTTALKQQYCRNYPAPSSAPATDTNPADYKTVHVSVSGPAGKTLADVDTQIAAKVSETASTTGALFVKIVDSAGNPISGAAASIVNTTVSPAVNANHTTDSNGIAIFYGLPPDAGNDYKITAAKSNYSTLATIISNGTLQPTYPNQNIITQASSFVTLAIKPQGPNSLVVETTNTNGAVLGNVKLYAKGGYKKYTATTDTSYYYDNTSITTDAGGLAGLAGLVPGGYYFCGDSGATSCSVGGTAYYLAAAVPYSGSGPLNPITVPIFDVANPPGTTFGYNGAAYYQKVRLLLSNSASFPRLSSLSPSQISLGSDPLASFSFTITGANLPCGTSSCATTVKFLQGSNTYTAVCTGAASGLLLNCKINVTGIMAGSTQLVVTSSGGTLTLPAEPLIGGFIVAP